jgi:lactoylglutathione lyase
MTPSKKARALGFNHIALEVGDVDEALAFYARIVDFKLRSKAKDMAFIDLGDQFLSKSAKAIKEFADKGMAPD